MALLQATNRVFEKLDLEGDEATGANIVRVAAEAPLKQIAINAGHEGGVVAERVRGLDKGHGLNAQSGEYVDMLKAGINDPVKVTRSALQNAASIAALFLTPRRSSPTSPRRPLRPCRVATAVWAAWTSESDALTAVSYRTTRKRLPDRGAAFVRWLGAASVHRSRPPLPPVMSPVVPRDMHDARVTASARVTRLSGRTAPRTPCSVSA